MAATITNSRTCPKCSCASYGITRHGDQEWIYCASCKHAFDAL